MIISENDKKITDTYIFMKKDQFEILKFVILRLGSATVFWFILCCSSFCFLCYVFCFVCLRSVPYFVCVSVLPLLFSHLFISQVSISGVNVCHNVGKLEAILCRLKVSF